MTLQLNRKLFTVEEYHRLAEEGFIKPTDRVELINGEILLMSPIKSNHAGLINRLNRLFIRILGDQAIVAIQNPIHLNDRSEPEPDIVIAKSSSDDYISNHPMPEDIFLIIEVADSSLDYDQTIKNNLYANAGIPEYWIINLPEQQIEIYRQPKNGTYHFKQIISESNDVVTAKSIDLSLDFDTIFIA